MKTAWLFGFSELKVKVESKEGDDVLAIEGISENPAEVLGTEGIVRVGENVIGIFCSTSVILGAETESDNGSASFALGTPSPAMLLNP